MLGVYEAQCELGLLEMDSNSLQKCHELVARLNGKSSAMNLRPNQNFSTKNLRYPTFRNYQ